MMFREILEPGASRFISSEDYPQLGIEVVENAPKEITAVFLGQNLRVIDCRGNISTYIIAGFSEFLPGKTSFPRPPETESGVISTEMLWPPDTAGSPAQGYWQ